MYNHSYNRIGWNRDAKMHHILRSMLRVAPDALAGSRENDILDVGILPMIWRKMDTQETEGESSCYHP